MIELGWLRRNLRRYRAAFRQSPAGRCVQRNIFRGA
jgi:hypothetical protein